MSNFDFLKLEFSQVYESALRAETLVTGDPRASAFYSRRTLEILVQWAYQHDPALKVPYQNNLASLIHEPTFKNTAGNAVFQKAKLIQKVGNRAVHDKRETPTKEATQAITDLFHICFWLARTYARRQRPADDLVFNPKYLSRKNDVVKQAFVHIQALQKQAEEKNEQFATLLKDKSKLDEELKALRAEVAKARKENEAQPDNHDYSEAETRDYFIDVLLKEAGWALDHDDDIEFPVTGMPNEKSKGFIDYVMWGDDGKPLGLVEAKRTRKDPRTGQRQAEHYADCLEAQFGQRPVIFYSNGYEHWIWDDKMYPPRPIQGFLKKDELMTLINRRRDRKPLVGAPINTAIADRPYQTRAIASVAQSFEKDKQRKSLLVMATGSGKTRTVIALADLLMNCNWAKRILFLADRIALVNQAVGAFKKHLPNSAPVNLVKDKDPNGRVYVSTYPTMMGLIDQKREDGRMFGPGHFDLIVIDEAHRSVYQRYGAIFEYFDSLLVGLTATPQR